MVRSNHRQENIEDSAVDSILQRYDDETMEAGHGSPDDKYVEIDPRLSDWNWSPPSSLYTPSLHQPQHTLVNATIKRHFPPPTAPPTGLLPDLPVNNAEDFLAPGHLQTLLRSTSSADSILNGSSPRPVRPMRTTTMYKEASPSTRVRRFCYLLLMDPYTLARDSSLWGGRISSGKSVAAIPYSVVVGLRPTFQMETVWIVYSHSDYDLRVISTRLHVGPRLGASFVARRSMAGSAHFLGTMVPAILRCQTLSSTRGVCPI